MTTGRRSPLQGGLPPVGGTDGVAGGVVEIGCDESGFSGTNLLDPGTPLLTHASVDLAVEEAAEIVDRVRSGVRWSLSELKSQQLLRDPRAGEALRRLLAALEDRAHVHLVDKELFLVTRIVDLFLAEPAWSAGTRLAEDDRPAALALYRAGRASGRDWQTFLAAFVALVRTGRRRTRPGRDDVDAFFRARDALAGAVPATEAAAVLAALDRSRVGAVLDRLAEDDRSIPPPLEPLLPALAETVLFWSRGRRRVLVVHDEQSALTPDRLRRLQDVLTDATDTPGAPDASWSPLAGLVTVDSRDDPRVQVADLLAGITRRVAADGAAGAFTGGVVERLEPFLSATSLRDPQTPRGWSTRSSAGADGPAPRRRTNSSASPITSTGMPTA